jgi:hypothetical protein
MRLYLLLLLLVVIPVLAFCPKRRYAYDNAIGKIMGKTWWQYKVCKNDTCSSPEDSLFFDGSFNDFKNYYKDYGGKCLTCITPNAISPYKDGRSGASMYLPCFDCMPLICFIDTSFIENIYPIFLIGLGSMKIGQISFISDSEFVISRQSLVCVDSLNTKEIVYSSYYKSVHLTK